MPKKKKDEDPGFTITDVRGPGVPPVVRASTRKAARGKLPPIPKAVSPSSSAGNDKPDSTPSIKKRRRSIGGASRSPSRSSDTEERDELEEGPSRKYARPSSSSKSPTKAAKAKKPSAKEPKQAKPKKPSKAAMERAKLEELRNDDHFGKLSEDTIKRIAKAYMERMYLIHRYRKDDNTLMETFDVSGSTGNVYKVTVSRHVNCSCMDFSLRRNVCKHLLFVYLKVLRLPGNLPVYSSVRLSEEQVAEVFSEALKNPVAEVMARPELRKAWETAVGYQPDPSDANGDGPVTPEGRRLIPTEGDVCGVCYEDLEPGSTEGLEFCLKSCGRPIHTDCLQTWFNTRGYDRTCIWCRAKWHEPDPAYKDPDANGYGIGLGHRGAVIDRATGRQLNLAAALQAEPAQAEPEGAVAALEEVPAEVTAPFKAVAAEADTSGWD